MYGYNRPYRGKKKKSAKPQVFFYAALVFVVLGVGLYLFAPSVSFVGLVMLCGAVYSLVYAATLYALAIPKISTYAAILRYLLICGLVVVLVSFFLIETLIFSGGRTSENAEGADFLIVLGAGVNGDVPSLSLQSRIDAAYGYLVRNPETRAVLSGGQGKGENISEAEAMRRALVAKGIESERLISEQHSTSTLENIQNSLALIDGAKITVLSNDYHVYRAAQIARYEGVSVEKLAVKTPRLDLAIAYPIREYFAVMQMYINLLFSR